jgi:ppGpp synthetase/RelA/SpoT-type nucleotidyltranferase
MSNNFKDYLLDQEPILKAWGKMIIETVKNALKDGYGDIGYNEIIKIEPSCRAKAIDSALGKIARKGYNNPIAQMTDLVGARFVVMLQKDIQKVVYIIENKQDWCVTQSRDYAEEIAKNPAMFDYQSMHFEVRPKTAIQKDGLIINPEVCCEVQVRSLLQHAYAEVTHDSIYKPVGIVPQSSKRAVAKGMALMEATDDMFQNVIDQLEKDNQKRNQLLIDLRCLYLELVETQPSVDDKVSFVIFDEFRDFVDQLEIGEIHAVITSVRISKIKERCKNDGLFSHAVVLFVYWLVDTQTLSSDEISRRWVLPGYKNDLETIFSDLDQPPSHHF